MYPRVLVAIEEFPWCALYRMLAGYLMVPVYGALNGGDLCGAKFLIWFSGVLVGLRLLPALIRKAVPFPDQVKAAWAERRQLAKEFDSYQWQKLLWFGVGMSGYISIGRPLGAAPKLLAVFCLISGGIGLLVWRSRIPD